jgi:hypothetical protein
MTKQDIQKLKNELAEAEANFAKMEAARMECIGIWNKAIREIKLDIERRRNELRSGTLQPELAEVLKSYDNRRNRSRIKAVE